MMSEETEQRPEAPAAEEFDFPVPPASFDWLVISMSMQAEMHMGHIRTDPDEQPRRNLKAAQHSIDMLELLQQKTRGNLTYDEERLLGNTLTELRFRYVQAVEESRTA